MSKRALSLIICIIMLTTTFVGTGIMTSANNETVDEIMTQAHSEPIDEDSVSAPEISTATADRNSSTVTPDIATATYSGKCGDNLTWSLDTSTGILNIDGSGDMYAHSTRFFNGTYITTASWGAYYSYIKSVVIGNSVTSIGDYAFFGCTAFASVDIGNFVTSIGERAFDSCSSLTSITIPDSVTSIGDRAFDGCSSLTSVVIGDSVTRIGDSAFFACTSLTSVTISDSVTSIGDNAFWNCTSLTSVTIPNSVTNISGGTFLNCTSLMSVTIPDSVTSIGSSAFFACTSLTSVSIPDSVISIGDYAFFGCDLLTNVTVPDSVTSIDDLAFGDCSSLISVTVDSNNRHYASLDGVLYNKDMSILIQYFAGNSRTSFIIPNSVTSIDDFAFYCCFSLTSITIPDTVTSIGYNAFYGCTSLTSVIIGNSVASIGDGAFYYCDSLTSVTIPDSVVSIGDGTFCYCDSLTSVIIGNSVISIGDSTFYCCSSLTSVIIPDSVISIADSAFSFCTSLTSVIIGNSVTSIGYSAFSACDSLRSVTIPDSVTSIGKSAFYDCTSLTSVIIPDSVTSIGDHAFHYISDDYYYKLNVTIRCYENSYAYTYAVKNGFKYKLMHKCVFTNYIPDNNASCTYNGTKTAYCDNGCGKTDTIIDEGTALGHSFTTYTDVIATCTEDAYRISNCDHCCGASDIISIEGTALGHNWSEWITTIEPTYTAEGEQIRFCFVCDEGESERIPVLLDPDLPVISVDNFTVTITNAEYIKDMRYAPGEHTTTTEIKNSEGNVPLDNGTVVKYTVEGNFVYDMPNAGYYTIWIRMKDGTNYIMPLDVTKVTPSVSTYGVKITLRNLYNVKDFYIAKGEYQTYREIKDNGYIVSVTGVKIGTKHDYTYTVYEPGVHTILVRYNDGSQALFHETLVVDEPVFATNGLQVTVSNLPDVKVIRTAYGEWNSVKELKATDTLRNFSAKTAIKGKDPYTIQYREDGMVTIIVEYNNGYQKVFHYNVQHKQASCTQTGSSVLLRNLDGFVMIRYAMGEYATSAEIKRAPGSKYLKPADLTNGYAVVSGLAKGTYTFCVQFDDESYNYFTVTVK